MILVVEDHSETRHALVELLRYHGLDPVGVEDGAQALLYLRTHTPRLVLLDYAMPGMNGLELLRVMRSDPRVRHVPVLLFTAHDSGRLREEALSQGACDYVIKGSVDWDSLLRLIRVYALPAQPARVDPDPG